MLSEAVVDNILMLYIDVQEKIILKEEKLKQEEKYMWAVIDGDREKVIFSHC